MKALILTEAGLGIGLGHVTRCTAVAQALVEAGASVTVVYGKGTAEPPAGVTVIRVETAEEMGRTVPQPRGRLTYA